MTQAPNSNFPLLPWHMTKSFEEALQEARKRLAQIDQALKAAGSKCKHGSVLFEEDGLPCVSIEHASCHHDGRKLTTAEALELAFQYGAPGKFGLDDLEKLARRQGLIIAHAMHGFGFRPGQSKGWVRKGRNDNWHPESRLRVPHPVPTSDNPKWDKTSRTRMISLIAAPNLEYAQGITSSMTVGTTGLIFVSFDADPFAGLTAESFPNLIAQLISRGHIAKEQEGFSLHAYRIDLGDPHGIMIRVVASYENRTLAETVWPTRTTGDVICRLAQELVAKVKAQK